MSPATPQTLGPLLVAQIETLIGWARQKEGTAGLGEKTEDLCRSYRALAICTLSEGADTTGFFHWLLHSPIMRKYYLETVDQKGLGAPQYRRVGFVDPILDAMAARQWELAVQIGHLSATDWLEGFEYEEDYCYGEFLRLAARGAMTEIPVVLSRWARVIGGGEDLRLTLAESIASHDSPGFEFGLRSLLQDAAARANQAASPDEGSVLASEYSFHPNRWVSIEGLALLAIAEREKIGVDFELEGCPRIARAANYPPFQPRAYPNRGLA